MPDGSRRFGILNPMVGSKMAAGALLAELTAEARAAEAAGFDHVMVPEHHAGPPGSLSEPVTVSGWLLASTSRVQVGPGVLVASLHHPVALAEQVSILQHASGGRFLLGIGAGYQPADFAIYGADPEARRDDLEKAIETLRTAWRGEEIAGQKLVPAMTGGVPEVWIGAWSRWGVRTAGRLGDGWVVDPIRSEPEVVKMAGWYRDAAEVSGRRARINVMRHLWVGRTDEEARSVYAPLVEPVYRYYLREGALGPDPGVEPADLVIGGALDDRVICGSPSTVVARIERLLGATGAEACTFALRHPAGPSHDQVLEAIRMLGTDVLPRLRLAD